MGLADLPPFYRNILSVWQERHSKHPITWKKWKKKYCGTTVLLRHKLKLSIFYKTWASKGIQKLNDLLDSHYVYSFPSKTSKVDIEYPAPFSITPVFSQFSQKWEKTPFETVTNQLQINHLSPSLTADNVSAKLAGVLLAEKSFCPPLAEVYLQEQNWFLTPFMNFHLKLPLKTN